MTNKIPTNTKNTRNPYKKEVFKTYLVWRSVQGFIGQSVAQEVVEKMGEDMSGVGEIFTIRNQTEFAKKYKVENSTLTNWNKLIDEKDLLKDVLKPMRRLTKNVIWALYKNVIETGDADRARLWFQFVEGWTYQSSHPKEERKYTVATITYATV
jgi:hypothetical protein